MALHALRTLRVLSAREGYACTGPLRMPTSIRRKHNVRQQIGRLSVPPRGAQDPVRSVLAQLP